MHFGSEVPTLFAICGVKHLHVQWVQLGATLLIVFYVSAWHERWPSLATHSQKYSPCF